MTKTAWFEYQLGNAAPTTVATSPFYFLLSSIGMLGVPSMAEQVAVFFALLTTSGISMAYLAQEFYGNRSRLVGLAAGLFYMLNPISMVIWHKFLLTYIFAYSSFPLLTYLFVKLIKTRRYSYAFWFGATSVIFSVGLVSPGFLIPIILSLLFYSVYHIATHRSIRDTFRTLNATGSAMVFLVAVNSWWILQLFFTAQYQFAQGFSSDASGDLFTLNTVSIDYNSTPVNLIRLIYWYYTLYGGQVTWGWFYSSAGVIALGFVPLGLATCAVLFGRRKAAVFPALLLGLVIYFAKGSAPPAPALFLWLFQTFDVFRVFRNPVETFGTLIPLAFSPLVGIGISTVASRCKSYFSRFCTSPTTCKFPSALGKLIAIGILLILTSVYVFPMWTGAVFTTATYVPTNNPSIGYSVAVPPYYGQLNSKMRETQGLYRVLVLPLDNGGATYSWRYGYNGGDIADELYDVPAVSQSLTYSLFGTTYLTSTLNSVAVSNPANFWKLAAITNSRFITLSYDLNTTDRRMAVTADAISTAFKGAYSPSVSDGRVELSNPKVTSVPMTDSHISRGWSDGALEYFLSVSSASSPQSNHVINATAYPGNGGIGVWIQLPANMTNTVSQRFLEVWLRSSQSGPIYVEARDPGDHTATWDGRFNPNYALPLDQWKLFVLPLNVPTQLINTPGALVRQNVTRLLVGMTNLSHTLTNFEIGGIFLDEGAYSGPARNISLVGQYGMLTLYELNSSAFLPRIYAATSATTENSTGAFLSNLGSFNPGESVVVQTSEAQRNKISIPLYSMNKPSLSFQMVSPSLYNVQVNAPSPFMLVLSETYNPSWVASGPWGAVPETNHFIVNGYANMWYITQPGVYNLQLHFLPNSYLTYGTTISLIVLTAVFVLVYSGSLKRFAQRVSRIPFHGKLSQ